MTAMATDSQIALLNKLNLVCPTTKSAAHQLINWIMPSGSVVYERVHQMHGLQTKYIGKNCTDKHSRDGKVVNIRPILPNEIPMYKLGTKVIVSVLWNKSTTDVRNNVDGKPVTSSSAFSEITILED